MSNDEEIKATDSVKTKPAKKTELDVDSTIEEIKKARKTYMKMAREQGKKLVKSMAINFFNQHPEVAAIRWAQYTPYFNDGDTCTFSVGEAYVKLNNSMLSEAGDYQDGWLGYYDFHYKEAQEEIKKYAHLGKKIEEFSALLEDIEDVLEISIGDHVEVTITRNGKVTVSEYEHD